MRYHTADYIVDHVRLFIVALVMAVDQRIKVKDVYPNGAVILGIVASMRRMSNIVDPVLNTHVLPY